MQNKLYSLSTELPCIRPIIKITEEADQYKTFFFPDPPAYQPGQFFMVWIPGLDEKPFTVSYYRRENFGITVQARGKFTRRLFEMKKGDKLGFRGPFGRGYTWQPGKRALLVGGGCGAATIATLYAKYHSRTGSNLSLLIGSRNKDSLLFVERFRDAVFVTDDGSFGEKGLVTEIALDLIKAGKIETLYMCGPELMMVELVKLCTKHEISYQMALERFMKCGFGICGQCICGERRVCVDGPVFDQTQIEFLGDFGVRASSKTSAKVYFSNQEKG